MAHVANITIDNTKVAADLTNFIVYVDLSDMNATFWSTVANGGGDIRVYKSDGITELAREVVSCNTATETGELHIKYTGTLSGSADTEIQIHADGTSSDYAVTDTYGRNAVWSDYDISWRVHNNLTDSAGNYNGTVAIGSVSYDSSGKVGTSLNCSTDKITTSLSLDNKGSFSISFWLYYNSIPDTQVYLSQRDGGGSSTHPVSIRVNNSFATNLLEAYVRNSSATTASLSAGGIVNGWYKIHLTYDGSNVRFYKNGSLVDTASLTGNTYSCGYAMQLAAGTSSKGGNSSFVSGGKYDEVKVDIGAVLSTDWIATEYNNESSPSTFYSVSDASVTDNTSNFFLMF